ncbi:PIN domain-containing protein [Parapedobacter sp. ISTM3]|uniref:PIN domain-containing protein n=1 Tax=Parapedobacter luteus TaxID=623280 RepID=A0A1T5FS78_9SPHI|nr:MULTISPECIES: PIN domain-containing protein [Parapedobacter]MBK1439653.1 PIN domain-containing protein [Parapedobacter sp. ISTM3]SKB98981.1 PIN domain-containing protein [Parapedobacter luteus]
MVHSVRFTCVLDTNVIYPIEIRDLLFWFAHFELFTPKWSKHIFDEWEEVMARKGISEQEAKRRSNIANQAFPDALVTNYESLISTIDLPDEKDRHVLAAAIKVNANIIVTNNLKDFPKDYLASFGLTARSADDFLADIVDLNHDRAVEAFRRMVVNRRNPAMDEYRVLENLRKNGLKNTADYLHSLL